MGSFGLSRYPMQYRPARWSLKSTETGTEPLSTAELKEQVRETASDEDTLIAAYGKAARQVVEAMTNRAIVKQTRVLRMDGFPSLNDQFFELPGGNILSVVSIAYTDSTNQAQTFTGFETDLETDGGTGRVHLAYNQSWPTNVREEGLPVVVTYEAGYDPDASPAVPVPDAILTGIRLVFADLFDKREAQVMDEYAPNPMLRMMLSRYRVWSIA